MTIQTEGSTIYVRCTTAAEDVLIIDALENEHISFSISPAPDGFIGIQLTRADQHPIPFLEIPTAEALALGHLLINLAQRHMDAQPAGPA